MSGAALCQEFRATVSGAVTDPTGAVIADAKITATETGTNAKTQTVSDSRGEYTIPFLAPGEYELSAEAAGFKRFVRQQIQLGPGDHPIIDIAFSLAPHRNRWR